MMINARGGADIDNIDAATTAAAAKQDHHQGGGRSGGNTGAASSASSWSRLKDPRIVRVSRAFGGKDRHSKVCTVRGLRDRRVRLSVPTAIQLYDLQDRLGLNQPSKVVDWLLNAAKHEIDELPPLQMIPNSSCSSTGNFTHPNKYFQPLMQSATATATATRGGLVMKIGNTNSSSINWDDGSTDHHHHHHHHAILRNKAMEEEEESAATRESNVEEEDEDEEERGAEDQEAGEEDQEAEQGADDNNNKRQNHFEEINIINNHGGGGGYINVSPSNNFFSSRHSSSTVPGAAAAAAAGGLGLLNSISSGQQPYSSLIRWDPSTLSLAQSQPHPQAEDFHNNFNVVSLGSGPPPHHQVLVYQPAPGAAAGIAATQHPSYFPSHITAASSEYAPKQINFQMLMSSTNPPNNNISLSNSLTPANEGRPFHFTTNFLPTHKDCGRNE